MSIKAYATVRLTGCNIRRFINLCTANHIKIWNLKYVSPKEYVSRRALLAMPALRPDCVEQFAPLFWERNCYSLELQEYQRIAVC